MAAAGLPATLKAVQAYLKTAQEYDKRDPVLAYYCRMYAVQRGIKIDSKSKEGKTFLFTLMDQLEQKKKLLSQEEAITSDVVGQAHVEDKAIQLFGWADTEDRAARFNKNVVKSFYTAQVLFDVLSQFGDLSDELQWKQKYAKWKAAYIHKCIKTGEIPIPGPQGGNEEGSAGGGEFDSPGAPPAPYPSGSSGEMPSYPPGGASGGMPSYPPGVASGAMPSYPPGGASGGMPLYPPEQPSQPPSTQQKPIPAPRTVVPAVDPTPSSTSSSNFTTQDFEQAQKLCRFAASALQYEDVPTAIDNLQKALALLQSK